MSHLFGIPTWLDILAELIATDPIDSRLKWAKKFGADEMFDTAATDLKKQILDLAEGRGVDNVIVTSGNVKATEASFPLARKGGKILLFGIPPQGNVIECDASSVFIREIILIRAIRRRRTRYGKFLK